MTNVRKILDTTRKKGGPGASRSLDCLHSGGYLRVAATFI